MSLNEIGLNLKWSQFDHLVIPVEKYNFNCLYVSRKWAEQRCQLKTIRWMDSLNQVSV